MKNNLLPIAKEGWNYIIGAVLFFVIFDFLDLELLQFLTFFIAIFLIFLFRNPEREHLYYQKHSVVAPVDGVVTSIEELQDDEYAYKIEIDSNYFNVSLLRMPFTSVLKEIDKQNGARLSPLNSLSKSINEKLELVFVDKESNTIKVLHRLKQSFMGIETEVKKSKTLHQGSRYGIMINGVTTLYLPQSFRLNIGVGTELTAPETLIGYFTSDNKNR